MLVKHDGDAAAQVVAGDCGPVLGAAVVHLHVDHVALHVVVFGACRSDGVALQHCVALEGHQLPVCVGHVGAVGLLDHVTLGVGAGELRGLDAPHQGQVGGQSLLGCLCVHQRVNQHAVGRCDHADNGAAAALHAAEQRVQVLALYRVVGQKLCQTAQLVLYLVIVVDLVELQVGAGLQQLGDALRLLDARKLEQHLAVLVLQLLDVGRYDAELVDTCAEDVEGCVHLRVHLLLQGLGHLLVGGSALELAQELAFAYKESRHCARLYVGRHARDEVLLVASGAGCLRLADCLVYLFELRVA